MTFEPVHKDVVQEESRDARHKLLAGVIDEVIRWPSGAIRVPQLADLAGYSRFHLSRLFQTETHEDLSDFVRRIRHERAAYFLKNGGASITDVAFESGYQSLEAFSRAFRQSFGVLPSEFRHEGRSWMLGSPVDLHWNPDWNMPSASRPWGESIVTMPERYAMVWRWVGNYSRLEEGWRSFWCTYQSEIPSRATYITNYLDNMWTHPVPGTMRSDIGWICASWQRPLPGMRRIVIPAGRYASTRVVERHERNDAWSHMSGRYCGPASRKDALSLDEYPSFPLPFHAVKTRILTGI